MINVYVMSCLSSLQQGKLLSSLNNNPVLNLIGTSSFFFVAIQIKLNPIFPSPEAYITSEMMKLNQLPL